MTRACEARAPGIVVSCAELVSVESWRADDAPTQSSTQTVARNLSRLVQLILVSVCWRERLSCESVPLGVELRSCIVVVVVEDVRRLGLTSSWRPVNRATITATAEKGDKLAGALTNLLDEGRWGGNRATELTTDMPSGKELAGGGT